MAKICDNKSVGVIIRRGEEYAIILRKNYPKAYACIAGHLDGDTFARAAIKEADEEGHIKIILLEEKFKGIFANPCKRSGGTHHEWQVFEATKWTGNLTAASDATEAFWVPLTYINALSERTKMFSQKFGISLEDVSSLTKTILMYEEWNENPGLEPVWLVMLQKMKII